MKALLLAPVLVFAASSFGNANGIGDVVSVEKRSDGLYDVKCSYNQIELGVTKKEIIEGNVCEAFSGLQSVSFPAMEFSGGCSIHRYEIKDGVVGSELSLSGLKITDKDFGKGCSVTAVAKIPAGYKLGLQKFEIGLSADSLGEADSVEVIVSGGNSGKTKTSKSVDKSGPAKLEVALPSEVFTPCATEKSQKKRVNLDIFLTPNEGKTKIKGNFAVYLIKLASASLARCGKE